MRELPGSGPNPETIASYIGQTFRAVDVFEMNGTTFFSFDPETHWPAFATLSTTEEYEDGSDLSRPGVFRLNIGVTRDTFDRLVAGTADPDYAVLDEVIPHPAYAQQHWVAILNPSWETFEQIVKPLLTEAHDRQAAVHARHHPRD